VLQRVELVMQIANAAAAGDRFVGTERPDISSTS
jgi:hypothetical protein